MSATPEDIAGAIADARNYTAPAASPKASNPAAEAIADARASIAPAPPSRTERFVQGVTDLPVGLGQLATHVAETPLNFVRKGLRKAYAAASGITEDQAGDTFAPIHAADYDRLVQERENLYEGQRQDAQQNGIDWWRIGGNAADPVNYVAPGGGATALGRVAAGTVVGAAAGAAAPSTHPGDFWADKAKGAAVGAATGGVLGTAAERLTHAVQAGVKWARGAFKSGALPKAATDTVADAIAKGAAANSGTAPEAINLDVLQALRTEAKDALEMGVKPSPEVIYNRAIANSLPVPVPVPRAWLARDAQQWSRQFNLKADTSSSVGKDIITAETEYNRALINNLNALGAKNAPDVVSAGQTLAGHIKTFDTALTEKIGEAYGAVRNSAGQPASMDGAATAQAIRDSLGEVASRDLPGNIKAVLKDLEDGKLPLNVKIAQDLDRSWSGLQSGKGGYGVSDSADRAIQKAKGTLLESPVTDAAGDESIAAYRVAKDLAKRRFAMIDGSPAYKAVVNGARDSEPEKFFRKYVMESTSREAQGLRGIVTQVDPKADELIGRTLMGEIKDKSLNGSEANGTFSQAKFAKFLDPVWQSRLKALLPDGVLGHMKNLNHVAELGLRPPAAAVPNRSGTAGALVSFATTAAKAGAVEKLSSLLAKQPIAAASFKAAAEQRAHSALREEVSGMLHPGVTSEAIPGLGKSAQKLARLSKAATIPAATLEMTRDAK